jgi:hypothetical protein
MLVERDGHLRFEAEISLQGTVAVLATDGTAFSLYDAHKNELSRGPACPANVASMIRIPLAPAEVAAILLGDVLLPLPGSAGPVTGDATGDAHGDARGDAGGSASVAWDAARGADVLVIKSGATETRVFFHPDGKQEIVGAAASGPAGPIWRASYEEMQDAPGGLRLPALIRFAERAGSFDDGVEIRFKDRTPNAEISPASFVIQPPAGAQVVEVGCNPGGDGDGAGHTGAAPRP